MKNRVITIILVSLIVLSLASSVSALSFGDIIDWFKNIFGVGEPQLAPGCDATNYNHDVNHDGKVDTIDVQIVTDCVLDAAGCNSENMINSDINCDGAVNVLDFQIVTGSVLDPEICNNNADDDGDNKLDCGDNDCAYYSSCFVSSPEICGDFKDNDGDGKYDYADIVDCPESACSKVVTPVRAGIGIGKPWFFGDITLVNFAGCCGLTQCYSGSPLYGGCKNNGDILTISSNTAVCSVAAANEITSAVWCAQGYVNDGEGECIVPPAPPCTETCNGLCGFHIICGSSKNCGSCGIGTVCNVAGICVSPPTGPSSCTGSLTECDDFGFSNCEQQEGCGLSGLGCSEEHPDECTCGGSRPSCSSFGDEESCIAIGCDWASEPCESGCDTRVCGPDPTECAENCGICSTGQTCNNGACVSCADTCQSLGFVCGEHLICDVPTICGTCPTGQTCNAVGQCVALPCVPADCNDNNPCTDDVCNAGVCGHTNDNANSCADANLCDGTETCSAGSCIDGTPINVNDNIACTLDICNLNGQKVNTPRNSYCDDDFYCNGVETCSANTATGCMSSGNPCGAGTICNEVTNYCDAVSTCTILGDLEGNGVINTIDVNIASQLVLGNPQTSAVCATAFGSWVGTAGTCKYNLIVAAASSANPTTYITQTMIDNCDATTTQGLIANWKFENNAEDSSGNNYDGVVTSSDPTHVINYVDGISGKSAKLLADNLGSVTIQESTIPGTIFINDYSIAGWFYLEDYSSTIIQKRGGDVGFIVGVSTASSYYLNNPCQINNVANKLGFMYGIKMVSGTRCGNWLFSQNTLELNKWYHFVAVLDKTTGKGRLYLNGQLQQEDDTITLTLPPISNLAMGGAPINYGTGWNLFNGKVDEIKIYNKVLTVAEITSMYNAEAPPACTDSDVTTEFPDGKNYGVRGTVNGINFEESGRGDDTQVFSDTTARITINSELIDVTLGETYVVSSIGATFIVKEINYVGDADPANSITIAWTLVKDYCEGGNVLIEYNCDSNSLGGVGGTTYTCPNGCTDGACVANAECIDEAELLDDITLWSNGEFVGDEGELLDRITSWSNGENICPP